MDSGQTARLAERVDLLVEPSAALRNATAQGRMMSILGPRAAALSDRELGLMDWGFAFGVAWAVARTQDPVAPEAAIALRALDVTRAVFTAYRGQPAPALEDTSGPLPAHAHPNGGGAADTLDVRTQHQGPHPPR